MANVHNSMTLSKTDGRMKSAFFWKRFFLKLLKLFIFSNFHRLSRTKKIEAYSWSFYNVNICDISNSLTAKMPKNKAP